MTSVEEIKEFVEMDGEDSPGKFIAELEDALVGCVERFGAYNFCPLYDAQESLNVILKNNPYGVEKAIEVLQGYKRQALERKEFFFVTGFCSGDYKENVKRILEANEEATTADGMEKFLVGMVEGYENHPIALYDRDLYIDALAKEFVENPVEGCEHDDPYTDAEEWYNYNVIGAWVGHGTPAFALISRFKS